MPEFDRERRREEEEPSEEIRVHDRRRFGPDGSRIVPEGEGKGGEGPRDAGPEMEPAEEEAAEAEAKPELVPIERLREWEARALDAEAKIREFADAYRHQKMELEAVRGRLERDQQKRVEEALGRAFGGMLEALDMLELALRHAEESPLKEGVSLVQRKMLDALAAEGLERMELVGEEFDPDRAEAIAMVPVERDEDAGKVVSEMRPGYRFRDRVLRPAQVHVGTKAPQA